MADICTQPRSSQNVMNKEMADAPKRPKVPAACGGTRSENFGNTFEISQETCSKIKRKSTSLTFSPQTPGRNPARKSNGRRIRNPQNKKTVAFFNRVFASNAYGLRFPRPLPQKLYIQMPGQEITKCVILFFFEVRKGLYSFAILPRSFFAA